MTVIVAVVGSVLAALAVTGPAQRVGFSAHQRVDEHRQQLPQHIGMSSGESLGQDLLQVDIVDSGQRVYHFARVTLVGLSKNHAMTFIYPATTRRHSRSGPTRTPLCWTQPSWRGG
jgi:hypothetical protein